MRRVIWAAAAGAILWGAAGAAFAGDGACVWKALPAEKRTAVEAAYGESLEAGLEIDVFTTEDFDAATRACGVTVAGPKGGYAGAAAAGYEVETFTARWITEHAGVSLPALEALYAGIPKAKLDELGRLSFDNDTDGFTKASEATVVDLVRKLHLAKDGETMAYVGCWLYYRLYRITNEAEF